MENSEGLDAYYIIQLKGRIDFDVVEGYIKQVFFQEKKLFDSIPKGTRYTISHDIETHGLKREYTEIIFVGRKQLSNIDLVTFCTFLSQCLMLNINNPKLTFISEIFCVDKLNSSIYNNAKDLLGLFAIN